jgi:hypothetical protein
MTGVLSFVENATNETPWNDRAPSGAKAFTFLIFYETFRTLVTFLSYHGDMDPSVTTSHPVPNLFRTVAVKVE